MEFSVVPLEGLNVSKRFLLRRRRKNHLHLAIVERLVVIIQRIKDSTIGVNVKIIQFLLPVLAVWIYIMDMVLLVQNTVLLKRRKRVKKKRLLKRRNAT